VTIRTNFTTSPACSAVIEDDVESGGSVTPVLSDHDWADGHPKVVDNRIDTRRISIGRGSWTGDIPDHSTAVDAPALVAGTTLRAGTPQ
jgi:acetyltransferase-like isoleucine patch superfamily enzyme